MSSRLVILASGSSGNAAVIANDTSAVLLDFGIGPRVLQRRLTDAGLSISQIKAALLSHTHTDHWKAETLELLTKHNIPIHAHPDHGDQIGGHDVRPYDHDRPFELVKGLRVRPLAIPHDAEPTFAFRFDATSGGWSLGWATDLGETPRELEAAFAGVGVLALEFNHDVEMQQTSRRPAFLIRRVLGRHGHLSNEQAADFAARIRATATPRRLKTLVALHRSRECNTSRHVDQAIRARVGDGFDLVHGEPFECSPPIALTADPPANVVAAPMARQQPLPGLDG